MRKGNASLALTGDEVRSFPFTVYYHKQRITVTPEHGIVAIKSGITVYRTSQGKKWHVEDLDTRELNLKFPPQTRKRNDVPLAPIMLRAMAELYLHGIDPYRCQGWGSWFRGTTEARERINRAFEKWKNQQQGVAV